MSKPCRRFGRLRRGEFLPSSLRLTKSEAGHEIKCHERQQTGKNLENGDARKERSFYGLASARNSTLAISGPILDTQKSKETGSSAVSADGDSQRRTPITLPEAS